MQLKSLEIQGFKSFPDKVKMTFDRGITAVVGPNGSGKSNIVDAVRWVFGEQSTKTLRGNKMEDVIFGGTALRKAQGSATVSLVIDNSDRTLSMESDEVTITRKLYRSGDSEYRLNGASVRLKDVYEMFMDTGLGRDGYSVIGQGKIAEIVSSKSGERREIFEEAAGISKYRYRRGEAERRLDMAQENMLRLLDILKELEERVGPLEKEAQKAKEFITLSEEKKKLEISVWTNGLDKLKKQLSEQEDKRLIAKTEHDKLAEETEGFEEEINLLYTQMQQCAVSVDGLRGKIREWDTMQAEMKSHIAVRENDIAHAKDSIEKTMGELEDFSRSGQDVEQQLAELADSKAQKQEETQKAQAQLDGLLLREKELEAHGSELGAEAEKLRLRRTALYENIDKAKQTGASSMSLLGETESRLEDLRSGSGAKEKLEQKLLQDKTECVGLFDEITERLAALANSQKGYELKLKTRGDKRAEIEAKRAALASSAHEKKQKAKLLEDMERSMEGYAFSVKYILQCAENGSLSGVHGPVSRLITTAPKYATAIEIALGGAMQNIVVGDESCAKQAIRLLDRDKKGRATFLPITAVVGKPMDSAGAKNCDGYVGLASELVEYEGQYSGIVNQLLGRIAVAEDLDCAVAMAKKNGYKFRIVTLDGQVINSGGSMTGGYVGKSTGILGRQNEIDALNAEAAKIDDKISAVAEELQEIDNEIGGIKGELWGIDAESKNLADDKIRAEGELKRLDIAVEQVKIDKNTAKNEEAKLAERLGMLKEQSKSTAELTDALQKELTEVSTALDILGQQRMDNESSMASLRGQGSELTLSLMGLKKDIQSVEEHQIRLKLQKENSLAREQELHSRIAELENSCKEISDEIAATNIRLADIVENTATAQSKIESTAKLRESCEKKTTELRSAVREMSAKKENSARELARLEERGDTLQSEYDSIIHRLWDEYELTRSQAQELAEKVEDMNYAQQRLTSLRNKIKSLGNVNVGAVEEYAEVHQRYEFMSTQLADVEKSHKELTRLIDELTGQMKDIFLENFKLINSHFSKIFVDLFGGGKANLTLTDENDVLGCGIDIFVQPPGKVIKNLAALSGGEQAFVAIAIYFAILKVNPSPFVILDEIEAALDDVNVSKYAQYLRNMTDQTQFIAVTHRRGTMEEADVLYGVTMQEEGVSKMLELRVSEIESKLGMK